MENLNRYERAKLINKLKRYRTYSAICTAITWIFSFLFFVVLDVANKKFVIVLPFSAIICTFVYIYILSLIFKIENLE